MASEVRDEMIRVELAIDPRPGSVLPLRHGMPASLEIRIEEVAPLELVLRAAGRLLGERAPQR